MRASEIMENASSGGTGSGSIASVDSAIGSPISRMGGSMLTGKSTDGSDPTPNTPKEYKKNKQANRRFRNSP